MKLAIILLCVPLWAGDWTIVPGRGAGPITSSTMRDDLPRLFPNAAIKDDQIELDEGTLEPATLVYAGDLLAQLAIDWKDRHPRKIFICFGRRRGPCKWETADGIRIGTRLSDLELMNGRTFTISGFGYNYGGNVISWDGGKLTRLDCGAKLVLTLDGDRVRGGDYSIELTSEERHSISGDRPIPSTTPAFHKLNPGIVGMLMRFDVSPCASR